MKKYLIGLLAIVMCLFLAGCGNTDEDVENNGKENARLKEV